MKKILLVDDREDDVLLLQIALKQCGYEHRLEVKADGDEAIQYLSQVQSTAYTKNSEVPDLVLLDIKMPKVTGHEVLHWIRKQMQFTTLPVVMLSSSDRHEDVFEACTNGANSY